MSKFLAQVIIYTTQVVTRAFVDAYRQAAANAARHGGAAAAGAQQAAKEAGSTAINKAKASFGGMTIQEARQILNVRDNATLHDIEKNYEHLFKVNEKKDGGSFYIQSKVVRAKEAMDWYNNQLKLENEAAEQASIAQRMKEEEELRKRAEEQMRRIREQENKKACLSGFRPAARPPCAAPGD